MGEKSNKKVAYGDVLCGSRGVDKWKREWEAIAQHVTVLDVRL